MSDGAFDMLALMSHCRAVCRENLVFCLIGKQKQKSIAISFIIELQQKNTPHPVHHQGELQTVLAWLTDPASLPTKREPSEIPVRDFCPVWVLTRSTPR